MEKDRVMPKDTKPTTVDPDWNDELAKTCPQHYPWSCWMCNRRRGITAPCVGRS